MMTRLLFNNTCGGGVFSTVVHCHFSMVDAGRTVEHEYSVIA